MGSALSKNVAQTATNSMNNVAVQTGQTCVSTVINTLNVSGNTCGGDLNVGGTQTSNSNIGNCTTNSTNNINVSNAVQEQASQTAQSINQMFNLSGTTEADNVFNATFNLANNIAVAYNQTCISNAINEVNVTNNTVGGNCNIDPDQVSTATLNCLQNNSTVIEAQNNLQITIDQAAKTKVQNFFAFLAFIVAGILLIGGIILVVFFMMGFFHHGGHSSQTVVTSAPAGPSIEQQNEQLEAEIAQIGN